MKILISIKPCLAIASQDFNFLVQKNYFLNPAERKDRKF
jgi:alpha-glucosidase (family GH31 glycosyl hydrolase)